MAKSLTAANCVLILKIGGLYDVPVQLQGFSADDVFDVDNIESAETVDGVDGKLSGGWIYKSVTQNITLQADSDSNDVFENWYNAQQGIRDLYYASGTIILPAVLRKFSMRKGILTSHAPSPSAKKILQPRKYTIRWEAFSSGPA
jgi:hypothetical protein